MSTRLLGCDFSSAPTRRKPIVVAVGASSHGVVHLDRLESFDSLDGWRDALCNWPTWTGAFDFPFGLPTELVHALGWPGDWPSLMAHYVSLSRAEIRQAFSAFCAARPPGGKFAHRLTDGPAGSSPSMKWVNPPVAFMMHAGVPRLLAAGAVLAGVQQVAPEATRVALEAYPGLLAREVVGRASYKSDRRSCDDPLRRSRRRLVVEHLESGRTRLGLTLRMQNRWRDVLWHDASGDSLDAVLCLVQAAWADARRHGDGAGPGFGLPASIAPLEGWIVTA